MNAGYFSRRWYLRKMKKSGRQQGRQRSGILAWNDSTIQDRHNLGQISPPLGLQFSLLQKESLGDVPSSFKC